MPAGERQAPAVVASDRPGYATGGGREPPAPALPARFGLGENLTLLASLGRFAGRRLSPPGVHWGLAGGESRRRRCLAGVGRGLAAGGSRQPAESRPPGGVSPAGESRPWAGSRQRRSLATGRGLATGRSLATRAGSPHRGVSPPGAGSRQPGSLARGQGLATGSLPAGVSPPGVSPPGGLASRRSLARWAGSRRRRSLAPGASPHRAEVSRRPEASPHQWEASRHPAVAGVPPPGRLATGRLLFLAGLPAAGSFRRWLPAARGVSLGGRSPFRALPARASVLGPSDGGPFRCLRARPGPVIPAWSDPLPFRPGVSVARPGTSVFGPGACHETNGSTGECVAGAHQGEPERDGEG